MSISKWTNPKYVAKWSLDYRRRTSGPIVETDYSSLTEWQALYLLLLFPSLFVMFMVGGVFYGDALPTTGAFATLWLIWLFAVLPIGVKVLAMRARFLCRRHGHVPEQPVQIEGGLWRYRCRRCLLIEFGDGPEEPSIEESASPVGTSRYSNSSSHNDHPGALLKPAIVVTGEPPRRATSPATRPRKVVQPARPEPPEGALRTPPLRDMRDMTPERPFDSAEYLDRPAPQYAGAPDPPPNTGGDEALLDGSDADPVRTPGTPSRIPTRDLTLGDVPAFDVRKLHPNLWEGSSTLEWTELWDFALTFDGYGFTGLGLELQLFADAARQHYWDAGDLPITELPWLRTFLFFEQRRNRAGNDSGRVESRYAEYLQALLEAIRDRLR